MATKKTKILASTRKSEGMRESIIRVATEIINAKSYALATLTGIAAALDMRDAALYHYFPNKQALAYACHRSSLERFEQLLHRADEAGGTGEEKLRHMIRFNATLSSVLSASMARQKLSHRMKWTSVIGY